MAANQTVTGILETIEQRLGFVPPFFLPAVDEPSLLWDLWRQTESLYLDNPLPSLFKEQLAALLGRYCPVAYCFVCHTCSLQPLGMRASAIVKLLESPPVGDEEIEASLVRARDCGGDNNASRVAIDHGTQFEADLFTLSSAVYIGGRLAGPARRALRGALEGPVYDYLVAFISYNRMCHDWVAAHPEISFEMDRRYVEHGATLVSEAPSVAELFNTHGTCREPPPEEGRETALLQVALERAHETERLCELADKRLEEVLRTLVERVRRGVQEASELRQVRSEAEATAKFAQELLAIVSHDLRSPLSAILVGATLLEQLGPAKEAYTRSVQRILTSARRALRLIDDLLDFSLARAGGGIPVCRDKAHLDELARSVSEELELAHPGRTVHVEWEGDCTGEWDAQRIEQVLSNLVGNALAHSPYGSTVSVSVRGGEDVVVTTQNINREGPIPAELIGVLFEPFKRGIDKSRYHVGLGLYIVDQIVKAHGGHIDVASADPSTTFTVHLPRRYARVAAPAHGSSPHLLARA
jgi:signal transduction histidine kinase